MLPQEDASEPFNWHRSLDIARSALKDQDSTAGLKLLQALTDAARMTDIILNRLFELRPGEILPDTLADWRDFLKTIYDDTRQVYLMHAELVQSDDAGNLRMRFEAIRDASRSARFGLNYMQEGISEQAGRESEVENLEQLLVALQAAVVELRAELQAGGMGGVIADIGAPETVYVPLVGRIAAGIPNLAEQAIDGYLPLPRQLVGGEGIYLLKVSGDSMIDAGILDSDLVVVHEQPEVENGQIAAALIGDEATIKTFKRSEGRLLLMPHNPAYQPIPADNAVILGKVVAVLRLM